jgi:murein peptide amidase A
MASITGMLSTLALSTVLGYSVQHRPIELIHVAGPGPRVLVVGCIHGNECAGMGVVAALRKAHPREDLWLVPTFNPDGLAHDTRQNAHGVDLNRNFPTGWRPFGPAWTAYAAGARPWSEPETRLIRSLVVRIHPRITIWFHQHLDLVWAYGRSSQAGRRYAELAGMPFYHHPWLAGTAANWQSRRPGGAAGFTVELPAGALSASGIARQVRAVLGVSSR